jgi:hypothetical protein
MSTFNFDKISFLFFNILFVCLIIPYLLYYLNIDKDALSLTGYKGSAGDGGFSRMGTAKLDATAIYFPCLLTFIYYLNSKRIGSFKFIFALIALVPGVLSFSFGFFLSLFILLFVYLVYNYTHRLMILYLVVAYLFFSNIYVKDFYEVYKASKETLGALDSRTEVWEYSLIEIGDSPIIGSVEEHPKRIPVQYEKEGDYGSHNIILEIWRRAGLFGMISFLFFYFIIPIFSNNYRNALTTMLLVLCLIYFSILHFYSNKLVLFALVFVIYSRINTSQKLSKTVFS